MIPVVGLILAVEYDEMAVVADGRQVAEGLALLQVRLWHQIRKIGDLAGRDIIEFDRTIGLAAALVRQTGRGDEGDELTVGADLGPDRVIAQHRNLDRLRTRRTQSEIDRAAGNRVAAERKCAGDLKVGVVGNRILKRAAGIVGAVFDNELAVVGAAQRPTIDDRIDQGQRLAGIDVERAAVLVDDRQIFDCARAGDGVAGIDELVGRAAGIRENATAKQDRTRTVERHLPADDHFRVRPERNGAFIVNRAEEFEAVATVDLHKGVDSHCAGGRPVEESRFKSGADLDDTIDS